MGVADELYALPPADFTRERDERAKALRKEGTRDEADAVKALRKPTVAAWALNQLARRRAKEVERLVAAGEELRAAQDELLAGGDRKAFQSAAAREREQVAKLADEATDLVSEAGERATPALREKIAETLHAAALDEDTAEELRSRPPGPRARGDRRVRWDDGGGVGGERRAVGRQREGARLRRSPQDRGAKGGGVGRGKGGDEGQDAKRRSGRRGARRRPRERGSGSRPRAPMSGTRGASSTRRTKAIAHAETRAEAARVHAEEANARAKTTAERLKEARRERAAAKKAHARAERALAGQPSAAPSRRDQLGRVRLDLAQRSGLRVEDEAADVRPTVALSLLAVE